MGASLSTLLIRYTGASVVQVFFITAAAFGALSLYGYTTKRSLSGFGTFLFMGLIGIIIASLVNIFVASTMLQWIVSVVGVGPLDVGVVVSATLSVPLTSSVPGPTPVVVGGLDVDVDDQTWTRHAHDALLPHRESVRRRHGQSNVAGCSLISRCKAVPSYGWALATSSFNSTPRPGSVGGMMNPESKWIEVFRSFAWKPCHPWMVSRIRKFGVLVDT